MKNIKLRLSHPEDHILQAFWLCNKGKASSIARDILKQFFDGEMIQNSFLFKVEEELLSPDIITTSLYIDEQLSNDIDTIIDNYKTKLSSSKICKSILYYQLGYKDNIDDNILQGLEHYRNNIAESTDSDIPTEKSTRENNLILNKQDVIFLSKKYPLIGLDVIEALLLNRNLEEALELLQSFAVSNVDLALEKNKQVGIICSMKVTIIPKRGYVCDINGCLLDSRTSIVYADPKVVEDNPKLLIGAVGKVKLERVQRNGTEVWQVAEFEAIDELNELKIVYEASTFFEKVGKKSFIDILLNSIGCNYALDEINRLKVLLGIIGPLIESQMIVSISEEAQIGKTFFSFLRDHVKHVTSKKIDDGYADGKKVYLIEKVNFDIDYIFQIKLKYTNHAAGNWYNNSGASFIFFRKKNDSRLLSLIDADIDFSDISYAMTTENRILSHRGLGIVLDALREVDYMELISGFIIETPDGNIDSIRRLFDALIKINYLFDGYTLSYNIIIRWLKVACKIRFESLENSYKNYFYRIKTDFEEVTIYNYHLELDEII